MAELRPSDFAPIAAWVIFGASCYWPCRLMHTAGKRSGEGPHVTAPSWLLRFCGVRGLSEVVSVQGAAIQVGAAFITVAGPALILLALPARPWQLIATALIGVLVLSWLVGLLIGAVVLIGRWWRR